MGGGGRSLAGGKYLVSVDGSTVRTWRPPAGQVWLEPSVNPATGAIAFVSARAYPEGAVGPGFDASRTLEVLNPRTGAVTPWPQAGHGVWDPTWAGPDEILYLHAGGLYDLRQGARTPVALISPIAGLQPAAQYYGQLWWDTALAWLPGSLAPGRS
jgi:hypothetical protein